MLLPAPAGMVPQATGGGHGSETAPRTRGDGPSAPPSPRGIQFCSPHPRGWSQAAVRRHWPVGLLPAPAGMVPHSGPQGPGRWSAPRTRGDGPWASARSVPSTCCSPHPRGWSLTQARKDRDAGLLPAPAGMVPGRRLVRCRRPAAPRTRGDGPSLRPARTGTLVCSPHPRGWSLGVGSFGAVDLLLPAPAGMVPHSGPQGPGRWSAPRTRGDGPGSVPATYQYQLCSPHPRGWSRDAGVHRQGGRLLPAPAGMVPGAPIAETLAATAPRTRGDGPGHAIIYGDPKGCSPHPRGWSQRPRVRGDRETLLPAPAGMVPVPAGPSSARRSAPRTRGDGPAPTGVVWLSDACSPHLRGWSHAVRVGGRLTGLLTAPAGCSGRAGQGK